MLRPKGSNKPQLVVVAAAARPAGATPAGLDAVKAIFDWSALVNVYPNPASTFISVEIPANAKATTLRLLDVNGKLMMERSVGNSNLQTIATQDFAAGTYGLMIETTEGWLRKKIVITR